MPYLLAALGLFALAMVGAAFWSGQLRWLRVVTGAEPTGPAGKPPPDLEPYNALPAGDNPKAGGARIARPNSGIPLDTTVPQPRP